MNRILENPTWLALLAPFRLLYRLALPEALRRRLRMRLAPPPAEEVVPAAPPSGPVARQRAHRAIAHSGQRAIGHAPHSRETLPEPLPATLVAFYLPQFHAIPENDAWWGEGFTEWRNAARALPQFEGHAQPRLPADLGFYDLRDVEAMRRQASLARDYGIGAFCFYFYWFDGKTLLETPLRNWLANPDIDFPFCLCWANEGWTRTWDGRSNDVLVAQSHGPDDDLAFIRHVSDYLRDPRYLRIDGAPILLVYRPELFPEMAATAARWRAWCRDNGIGEIHLAYVQSFERHHPSEIGFDSAVEFPPNLGSPPAIDVGQRLLNPDFQGDVVDWRVLVREMRERPAPEYPTFPGVNCGWDNEPRRPGKGRIHLHASPRGYRDWLAGTIRERLAGQPPSRRLVFINAWNEWAEGAVLEPDLRLGHAWLHATRQALQAASATPRASDPRPCAVVHAWYPELLDEIVPPLLGSRIRWRIVVTTAHEREGEVRERLGALGIDAEIVAAENRGRDILPFLRVANRLLDEGVQVVLKIHGKRSTHLQDGNAWRDELLDRLLEPARIASVLEAIRSDAGLGLVAPEGHLLPLNRYWGANAGNVQYLAARLGIGAAGSDADQFIAGSMYWARLEALRPLLDAHLDEWEFEPETGQIDGTMAHAIERLVCLCAAFAGYRTATVAAICDESAASSDDYRYARPG